MEPISILVTALATGAAAALKETASRAIKDTYAGLKQVIVDKYAQAKMGVDLIEQDPASEVFKSAAQEMLEKTEAPQNEEVLEKARQLLEAVQTHDPQAAEVVGVSLEDIEGANLRLTKILAEGMGSVTAVKVKGAKMSGDVEISGVTAKGGFASSTEPPPSAAPESKKIKILFLAANPTDGTRLRLDEEVREIDESLRLAEYRDAFDLEQHWAVRVSDLQGLLLRHQPAIVHFSGHGSASGEILLEDDGGQTQTVTPRALSTTFDLLKDNIRCVVLNACFSQIQAQTIAEHIDCVVGMTTAIGDRAAINFAAAFYQGLGYGRNVQEAFELGRNLIDLTGLDEQDTPQLLASKVDPSQIQFAA